MDIMAWLQQILRRIFRQNLSPPYSSITYFRIRGYSLWPVVTGPVWLLIMPFINIAKIWSNRCRKNFAHCVFWDEAVTRVAPRAKRQNQHHYTVPVLPRWKTLGSRQSPYIARCYHLRSAMWAISGYESLQLSDRKTFDNTEDTDLLTQPAVAVLFRRPDRTRGTWKRVLSRDDLDPDEPRVVAVRDNTLILRSSK